MGLHLSDGVGSCYFTGLHILQSGTPMGLLGCKLHKGKGVNRGCLKIQQSSSTAFLDNDGGLLHHQPLVQTVSDHKQPAFFLWQIGVYPNGLKPAR